MPSLSASSHEARVSFVLTARYVSSAVCRNEGGILFRIPTYRSVYKVRMLFARLKPYGRLAWRLE